jgi:hypothetical protein
VIDEISIRQDKKIKLVEEYIENEAPWHRAIIKDMDFTDFPYNASNEEIEAQLQKRKYKQEAAIKREVTAILKNDNPDNISETVSKIVSRISDSSKNDLIHYIALRRNVLELFGKSLELDAKGEYSSEGVVHDIIFPTKNDSDSTGYHDHNLWIIDERLNFTSYISSDLPLNGGKSERPDLITYGRRVAFRGDNESSNPITVFEFKKPNRDDFVNPSSKEDPVEQIIRYVNNIKEGNWAGLCGMTISIYILRLSAGISC